MPAAGLPLAVSSTCVVSRPGSAGTAALEVASRASDRLAAASLVCVMRVLPDPRQLARDGATRCPVPASSSLELLLQPNPRDVVDLLQGGPELGHRVVVQALLEQVEDAELGVVADGDHEGEAEPLLVLGVHPREG